MGKSKTGIQIGTKNGDGGLSNIAEEENNSNLSSDQTSELLAEQKSISEKFDGEGGKDLEKRGGHYNGETVSNNLTQPGELE